MLDYPALLALHAVVREGSFERAARSLHVTPSAVSQRVRLLEERMGCALVVRTQPCRPTETGRRLCQHVDQLRLLEQQLLESLPTGPAPESVRVSLPLAVNADSLATWLMPVLADFGARAPVLIDLSVDDQDHTSEWLRQGSVLAALTASARAPAGSSIVPLGAMRYVATASPAYMQRHFAEGVHVATLSIAPSLVFNSKDGLQARWARRQCGQDVQLASHVLPSSQAFVSACLAGMGWGLHPLALVRAHLAEGSLVELVPGTPLDVPLYWQQARAAGGLLHDLSQLVRLAARQSLLPA